MTNGFMLKEQGSRPADTAEYAVSVHPGIGAIYDIYPACPRCVRPAFHECEAQGPVYRVFVPRY